MAQGQAKRTTLASKAAPAHPQTEVIELPPARKNGGMPLISALQARHSTREFSDQTLSKQALSDLLWAAFGINRPNGDRTAPYWRHVMVIDVHLAMQDGVWLYQPIPHILELHLPGDIRRQTGYQDFVATAPLNLIYVAHGERMMDVSPEERRLYASVDAGFIGQNVYLFCASEELATAFRGAVNYTKLARTLRLPDQQFVTFAQTVGYARG
jgi:nitroreductase family protein